MIALKIICQRKVILSLLLCLSISTSCIDLDRFLTDRVICKYGHRSKYVYLDEKKQAFLTFPFFYGPKCFLNIAQTVVEGLKR